MGTKLDPGKYDCHTKAYPNEPLFTLLARDPTAPAVVRFWCVLRFIHDGFKITEKIKEAWKVAKDMRDYCPF